MKLANAISPWTQGPFSSVAVGLPQEAASKAGGRTEEAEAGPSGESPDPDRYQATARGEFVSPVELEPVESGPETQALRASGLRSGLDSAAAFPQIVHLLATGADEIVEALSDRTGLPVLKLEADTAPEELAERVRGESFDEGFILHGVPATADQADLLRSILSPGGASERRILSWEGAEGVTDAVFEHYVNEGDLWLLPRQDAPSLGVVPALETALEALKGLPALE